MPKLSPRAAALKRLRKQADALWQQCVKLEHPQCEVCGEPTQVGHHYYTVGSSAELRYDLGNGIGLCNGCHFTHHNKSDPDVAGIVVDRRGREWRDELRARRTTLRKRNRAYYEGEIERLTERLGELEGL